MVGVVIPVFPIYMNLYRAIMRSIVYDNLGIFEIGTIAPIQKSLVYYLNVLTTIGGEILGVVQLVLSYKLKQIFVVPKTHRWVV